MHFGCMNTNTIVHFWFKIKLFKIQFSTFHEIEVSQQGQIEIYFD